MFEYSSAVFIGRFQPFHKSHLEIARHGLEIAQRLIIIVGSSNAAPNIKNPFSFDERSDQIRSCFSFEENTRLTIIPVRDYFNNDNHWLADVQQKTSDLIFRNDSVALMGGYKDSSSYYLKMFPQWEFVPTNIKANLNATDFRHALFNTFFTKDSLNDAGWQDNVITWKHAVPTPIWDWLMDRFIGTERHERLCREYRMIEDYKKSWAAAPFPPVFVTTDAVVVQSGHVLLVKRKFDPGKGLLALPGGFIKQFERLEDSALRELREETGIRVPAPILRSSIKESKVFDHPGRSLRGRTITHAYYIKLADGELPEVKGGDDASKAFWLPLMDVGKRENEFFDDHFAIVNWFVGR